VPEKKRAIQYGAVPDANVKAGWGGEITGDLKDKILSFRKVFQHLIFQING
jgi:hypothetical protein